MVNGHGPYDFMLDTGTTIMVVDLELGQELALEPQAQGTVTTLTQQLSASIAVARRVDFGPMTEQNVEVMIRELSGLRKIAPTVRGVLGQNALNHSDFLLDYQHKQLQFDTDGELMRSLAGHHIPLRRSAAADNPRYGNLVVHGSVADGAVHPMDFLLDSGAASPVIFDSFERETIGYPEAFVADTAGRQSPAGVRDLQFMHRWQIQRDADTGGGFQRCGSEHRGPVAHPNVHPYLHFQSRRVRDLRAENEEARLARSNDRSHAATASWARWQILICKIVGK